MKKTILSIIIFSLLFGAVVFARETELPDPGLTPDSPFYFLETIAEGIGTFFTFGDLKKAERYAALATERVAEAQAVVEKGKPEAAQIALKRYEDQLNKSLFRAEKAKAKGIKVEKVTQTLAEATGQHLRVLEGVLEKVPEKAKEVVAKAKEISIIGQKNALRGLAIENPERATEINLKTAEVRLNRAQTKAEEGEIEEAKEAIKEFEDQHKFGEEISQIAQGLGKDTTTVEQLVGKATSIHLEVLAEVYKKVPEQAKPAIERAMEVSVKGHKKAVEVLKEKDALGEIPEIAPVPKVVPIEVKTRIEKKVKEEIEKECLREGRTYMPGEDKQCCIGLKGISLSVGDGRICSLTAGYVCTAFCGDGKCEGKYENPCNCPEDCPKSEKEEVPERPISCKDSLNCPSKMKCENSVCVDVGCVGEGGMGPSAGINPEWLDHLPTECCEGLKSIAYSGKYDENCNFKPLVGAPSGVCSKCGNGICEKWETKCNCPDDCFLELKEEVKDETADLSSKDLSTEDWKVYRNEEYGYEIKYPQDWKTKERRLMSGLGHRDFVWIQSNGDEFSVDIWDFSFYSYDQLTEPPPGGIDPDTIERKEIIIDSQSATELSYVAVGDGGSGVKRVREIFIQKNQLLYKIRSIDSKKCDQILSTFKFIK